jgi:glycosyltransferase involved in cell wall biosynthesis
MRILHTSAAYWPFIGGAETYLKAMSERLVCDGHDVTVAASDASRVQCFWDPRLPRLPDPETWIGGVRVVRSPLDHLPFSPWSFYLLRRLTTELARIPLPMRPLLTKLGAHVPSMPGLEKTLDGFHAGFDLVHGVNIALEWPLIAGWRYARRRGLPFVTTPFVHVGPWHVQRNYTMPHQLGILRDADRVVVQTSIEEKELVKLGVPQTRIVRLGMGVDLDQLQGGDGAQFREEHRTGGPIVTFMGAVTEDKGIVHLMEAMQHLWRGGSEATLVIAGSPVEPSSFRRVYAQMSEAHRQRTLRLGPVSGQLKQDMLAATDVFAMPSRVDSFGIVYLEAWAYGVPVIGCRAGGVPDVIDDGHDGLLVKFGDSRGLASVLESLLADPDRRRKMGQRGRSKVEGRYTWRRIFDGLRAIYAELAAPADR